MSWVAVAIGGSALLGYLGSQNAASAQAGAANQASNLSQSQYNQTRQDQMPWMQRGNAAGNMLAYLMGLPGYGPSPRPGQPAARPQGGSMGSVLNGATLPAPTPIAPRMMGAKAASLAQPYMMTDDSVGGGWSQPGETNPAGIGPGGNAMGAPSNFDPNVINPVAGSFDAGGMDPNAYGSLSRRFGMSDFQADPGYEFRLSEGLKALQRSGAAKGLALSGAQAKALTRYNSDFASNEYGNAYNRFTNDQTNLFNRLSGISGTGQQANQFVGTMGANMAGTVGNNIMSAGNANAAGIIGGTNAINNGVNQWQNWNMWNSMMNGSK